MSLHVKIEDPKCMGTAEEAIGEGIGVKRGDDSAKVAKYESSASDIFYGISAEAADADGDGVRFYGPGEYCRAVAGGAIALGSGEAHTKLTLNSDGKLVVAGAEQPVHAIWCPKPGQGDAALNDFIIVQVAGWAERLLREA